MTEGGEALDRGPSQADFVEAIQHTRTTVSAEVAAEFADRFPPVELLTVEDVFGGWDKVESEHLASGGILDQVFTNQ